MGRKEARKEELRTRLAELSSWQTATRDDADVAITLHETRAMDQVYPLNEAAFFDELFHFVREIGAWELLEGLDPGKRAGALYPFIRFVLVTVMRCVGGVSSMLATRDVLLTDEALMGVLGFNAAQVRDGSNDRGSSRRTRPVEIRGPFSYETVADNIVGVPTEKLVALLNGVIRCLAKQGVFPKRIDAVLDATDDEATPTYETDDGREVPSVTREKRPDVRANRHAKKIKVTVFGWKVWVVWEPVSRIPLAIALDDINVADNEHAYEVVEQARKNVEGYATLRSLALDRGFLDGKLLWKLDGEGIVVYIPAKSNMTIARDAREIARRAEILAAQGRDLEGCTYKERIEKVRRGSGKNATVEERKTVVVGVRELPCDWWTAEGSTSAAHSKGFQPKLLNATVVLRWDGAPADAEKEVVFLTSDPAADPFAAFDAYDDRSLIENTCNREAKESWFLEHHPKRSEAGMRVHAYFVFTCMALVVAFRLHQEQAEEAERRGEETGIGRFRRQLEMKNRDKVVVFCGEHFGIFRNFEVVMLLGATVRDRALMGETVRTVLDRYGRPRVDSS
ncbi:MAG: transposase [Thermoanaerobaculia bacterium]